MLASYAGCDEILAVISLTISVSAHGFNSAGAAINLFDLSPNYVAPMNAVINSLATVVGISAPYIAGVLTPNVSRSSVSRSGKITYFFNFFFSLSFQRKALLSEWRLVFWITFILHLSEIIVFTTFGSAKTQPWNSLRDLNA